MCEVPVIAVGIIIEILEHENNLYIYIYIYIVYSIIE